MELMIFTLVFTVSSRSVAVRVRRIAPEDLDLALNSHFEHARLVVVRIDVQRPESRL